MKYLLWTLLLFAAAVALTTAAHNPAYVLLVYPPYRIELSFTLFVVLLIFLFTFGYGLVRITVAAVQLPEYVRKFRLERTQEKARDLLNEALNAFFEGRYAAAEKASAHAMELGDTAALHPIIAAHSAHKLREYEKRDAYLAATEGKDSDATMHLMAAITFMLDQRDTQSALHALKKLRENGVSGHPGVLSLELRAQQQAGNWDEVLDVVEQLEKHESIDVTAAEQLRQQAWLEKIRQQEDMAGLTDCLKNLPVDFKLRSRIAAAAAEKLMRHGGCQLAQQLLADSLNAQWDSELVARYGDCQNGDLITQIRQAENWLNQHPNDALLLLALGKLCLHQKLWGKAQNYLDASISISPSHAAYQALGQLAEGSGNPGEALKYYQQATEIKASKE